MLEDLSHHILDIGENSMRGGASSVTVSVEELIKDGWLRFSVVDDGRGMDEETCRKVVDPFYTTRTTRKVGLGIPFLRQSAELCEGEFKLESTLGEGTSVLATFRYDSIDRPPLGDIPSSVMTLLVEAPRIRWIYRHVVDERSFEMDSVQLWEILGEPEALADPSIALWLKDYLGENIAAIKDCHQSIVNQ